MEYEENGRREGCREESAWLQGDKEYQPEICAKLSSNINASHIKKLSITELHLHYSLFCTLHAARTARCTKEIIQFLYANSTFKKTKKTGRITFYNRLC